MLNRKAVSTMTTLSMAILLSHSIGAKEPKLGPYNAWNVEESEGCTYNGEKFAFGELKAMNQPELEEFKVSTGYQASDGYAVLMICSYLVNPQSNDHPPSKARDYRWVAFSW
ncbi:hypothetical protein F7Q91_03245 [Vibrio chagasii]|uniref:Uncharacterized protein n=1 Tax=Vibrio chagasii TaxID=170679 RepID=A0A7V7TKA4_9VIBR|nr:hypothetical protein [Vibrio chagasii]KAB0482437.1 hypothetical protein F7Q91_03245 [Vibrio chagasii]